MNTQTAIKGQQDCVLCLYVADPATLLASKGGLVLILL